MSTQRDWDRIWPEPRKWQQREFPPDPRADARNAAVAAYRAQRATTANGRGIVAPRLHTKRDGIVTAQRRAPRPRRSLLRVWVWSFVIPVSMYVMFSLGMYGELHRHYGTTPEQMFWVLTVLSAMMGTFLATIITGIVFVYRQVRQR